MNITRINQSVKQKSNITIDSDTRDTNNIIIDNIINSNKNIFEYEKTLLMFVNSFEKKSSL